MTDATPLKAAIFDAYGTLFDVHAPAQALSTVLGDKTKAFSELWRRKQLEYTWLRSLMGDYADFCKVTADALDYALQSFSVEDQSLRETLLRSFTTLEAYPDARQCLSTLKEHKLRTGILSNGSPSMLSAAVASAGLGPLLDYVLSVDTVQTYKPSAKVYQLAVEALGLEAPQIAFVSANGWDCAGAAAFGFAVVHVNRLRQPLERLGPRPKIEVATLSEAASFILSAA